MNKQGPKYWASAKTGLLATEEDWEDAIVADFQRKREEERNRRWCFGDYLDFIIIPALICGFIGVLIVMLLVEGAS